MFDEKENKKIRELAEAFASDYVKAAKYPDKPSKIELDLYSIPGRDIL